ncbi:hypothetical protein CDD83_3801 [Cordyceps sp. RAO-2017]|nr:hypothetical protein CDD83_3801 [Cordyceps sp. RAO-2017]
MVTVRRLLCSYRARLACSAHEAGGGGGGGDDDNRPQGRDTGEYLGYISTEVGTCMHVCMYAGKPSFIHGSPQGSGLSKSFNGSPPPTRKPGDRAPAPPFFSPLLQITRVEPKFFFSRASPPPLQVSLGIKT